MVVQYQNALASMTKSVKPKRQEEEVFLAGTFKWMKHTQPDFQFEPAGKWSTVIFLAGEELEKFRELQGHGIKNTLKKDPEEGWHATLSRKCTYTIRGRDIGRDPPEVYRLEEGTEKHIPILDRVGNGSTGVAKCILWRSANFPGANLRWEAARVDNLVEFSAANDLPDGGQSLMELNVQPKEQWF